LPPTSLKAVTPRFPGKAKAAAFLKKAVTPRAAPAAMGATLRASGVCI
jgi:hypothetical protein